MAALNQEASQGVVKGKTFLCSSLTGSFMENKNKHASLAAQPLLSVSLLNNNSSVLICKLLSSLHARRSRP